MVGCACEENAELLLLDETQPPPSEWQRARERFQHHGELHTITPREEKSKPAASPHDNTVKARDFRTGDRFNGGTAMRRVFRRSAQSIHPSTGCVQYSDALQRRNARTCIHTRTHAQMADVMYIYIFFPYSLTLCQKLEPNTSL